MAQFEKQLIIIMDKDKLRHGKETVNTKWDNDIALLAGDAMLALALKKLNTYSKNHWANLWAGKYEKLVEWSAT